MGEGRSQALPSPSSRSEPGGADLPGGLTALLHGDLVRLPQTVHWELFGLLPSELCEGTQPLLPRILLTSHCWFPLLELNQEILFKL